MIKFYFKKTYSGNFEKAKDAFLKKKEARKEDLKTCKDNYIKTLIKVRSEISIANSESELFFNKLNIIFLGTFITLLTILGIINYKDVTAMQIVVAVCIFSGLFYYAILNHQKEYKNLLKYKEELEKIKNN
jgi:hypothetical protein